MRYCITLTPNPNTMYTVVCLFPVSFSSASSSSSPFVLYINGRVSSVPTYRDYKRSPGGHLLASLALTLILVSSSTADLSANTRPIPPVFVLLWSKLFHLLPTPGIRRLSRSFHFRHFLFHAFHLVTHALFPYFPPGPRPSSFSHLYQTRTAQRSPWTFNYESSFPFDTLTL